MTKPKLNEQIKQLLKEEANTLELSRTTTLTKSQCDLIIEGMKKEFNLSSDDEAFIILAITSQQGGTARGCSGNFQFKFKNETYKLARIRNVFKEKINDRYGLRKFARTHGTYFHEICTILNLPGNLYNKVKELSTEELTQREKIWLSDFQSENDDCPQKLKKLIKETFKNKKTQKNKR